MSFIYPTVSNLTSSLNSGSYLDKTDYSIFYKRHKQDLWYGKSAKDGIEFSVYDLDENLISWEPKETLGHYKEVSLTYYDKKNNQTQYTYNEFIFDYPLYKTEKILVNPLSDVSSSNIPNGNYILAYQFTRYLAGAPSTPLIIKDISQNRKEIKLIPSGNTTPEYFAFCVGKILLHYVSPLYLILTKEFSADKLYKSTYNTNKKEIESIKTIFSIPDDGKFVEFLNNVYNDYIKYTVDVVTGSEKTIRIQGIKTYFSNLLVSEGDKIYSFSDIKSGFEKCVAERLQILFDTYTSPIYTPSKQYLFNLFVNDYFVPIHEFLQKEYVDKYNGPLKNALSADNGQFFPIITTAYLDEKNEESDPLTLLVKLQNPLSDSFSLKSSAWVSNIAMVPFLFNAIIESNPKGKTIKISPADFTIVPEEISFANSNKLFDTQTLDDEEINSENIDISKKINELHVDYTSFSNFVIFSSAELRHNIFKNKMVSLCNISSSITDLNSKYVSSGYAYPYYTEETQKLEYNRTEIIDSFDGFESYLYTTGYYQYNSQTKTFYSASFVEDMDSNAKSYDKNNRDSLVNNTPEHILSDENNDDYLIFLSMVGHYFDNIYLYIKSLPSQKSSENTEEFSRKMLEEMLKSFGWNIDASLEKINVSENYLDISQEGTTEMSAEERTRQVWSRILNNLPIIYKTKGVEECVRLILSCYGVPSTLINVREYGGMSYEDRDKTSYSVDEKIFMLSFRGMGEMLIYQFFGNLKTIEFKVALDPEKEYIIGQNIPLLLKASGSAYLPGVPGMDVLNFSIGVKKEPEKFLGRVYLKISGSSVETIETEPVPIFNGQIFNIMIRKNYPDPVFEYNQNLDLSPIKYDLWVQRREDSIPIYSVSASAILDTTYNVEFSQPGIMFFGNLMYPDRFHGLLDKILMWDTPISDETFIDHCNNINSYSYIGPATPHETLWYRMNYDYPEDVSPRLYPIKNANDYYKNIVGHAYNFPIGAYSSSIENCKEVSQSVYPYQFKELSYNQTYTANSYGPNRFKNEKVNRAEQKVEARLDVEGRSTYVANQFVSPDSNQIGLFADPNDYKNKDILRYFGNVGIIENVADPAQMFDDRYRPLRDVNKIYNQGGDRRTLYNELFTLYRFYFDKSIFEVIKQVIPARNICTTGILIEPTVLERPKYQYKPIESIACKSNTTESDDILPVTTTEGNRSTISTSDSVNAIQSNSGEVIYANFGELTDWSGSVKNTGFDIDLTNLNVITTNYNFTCNSGIIFDIENPQELETQCDNTGKVLEPPFSGSKHRYMIKNWKKDSVYFNNGEYDKPQNVSSHSIYLYTTQFWEAEEYKKLVYMEPTDITAPLSQLLSPPDYNPDYSPVNNYSVNGIVYYHYANTFKNRPNTRFNNAFYKTVINEDGTTIITIIKKPLDEYHETIQGYPRNHLTHKRMQFSNESFGETIRDRNNQISFTRYVKSRQTIETTVEASSLTDDTLPVQSINVSNINVVSSDNVLNK